jgi:hypothetical protein
MDEAAINVITPVIESSVIVAGEYMKKCNRTTLTAKDMEYALKYCSRNVLGKHVGTLFPELEDEDSDEDSDSLEEVDEDDEPFTRYTGEDEIMIKVNECYDTWEVWEPESPAEIMLKNAIDKNII